MRGLLKVLGALMALYLLCQAYVAWKTGRDVSRYRSIPMPAARPMPWQKADSLT